MLLHRLDIFLLILPFYWADILANKLETQVTLNDEMDVSLDDLPVDAGDFEAPGPLVSQHGAIDLNGILLSPVHKIL
jgi:hypothetical protein